MANGGHSAKFKSLLSARALSLGKEAFLRVLYGHFAERFGLCTRQSDQFFFVPVSSVFRYKYNKNISLYRDITGNCYNKYVIDKYHNNTDTNNTSPSHISQVRYISQVHYKFNYKYVRYIEQVRYIERVRYIEHVQD